MRIFLLTRNFPPLIDGVGDYTFELYRQLRARGYDVKVITGSNDKVSGFIKENRIEQDVFPIINRWGFRSIGPIVATLRKEKADWFYLQYVPNSFSRYAIPFFFVAMLIRLFFTRTKSAVFFHEISVRIWFNGIRAFFWGIAQRSISYSLYMLSDFSLTSNSLYQRWLRPFKVPMVYIPPNIYPDGLDARTAKAPISPQPALVLSTFINRCSPHVIKAVSDCILRDNLNIRLVIIGSSTKQRKQELLAQISAGGIGKSVLIFDMTGKTDLAGVLQAADIFLHMEQVSARGKGGVSTKSGVMASAFAAGLPIIGSLGDMTDLRLYVEGENILFADPSSSDSIRGRINQLCVDESFRKKLATNSRLTYHNFFDWKKVVDSTLTELSRN